jgi:hypothetical protein
MPDSINVGSESNVMFSINNTGKVILYNVMVAFEADSIVPTDTYVGNIKSGETGNVDAMLTGAAPTMDDGKVTIKITYEDENGEVQEPIEKELTLYVSEPIPDDYEDMMAGDFSDVPTEEPSLLKQYAKILIPAAAVLAVIVITVIRVKRKKKKAAIEEELDDEIS